MAFLLALLVFSGVSFCTASGVTTVPLDPPTEWYIPNKGVVPAPPIDQLTDSNTLLLNNNISIPYNFTADTDNLQFIDGPTCSNNNQFVLGANVPWGNFGWDYGSHYLWGNGYSSEYWENTFAAMKAGGATVARVWIFCDGRAIPRFDDQGNVLPLPTEFFVKMSDMLQHAENNNIKVMPVLWSHGAFENNRDCCGNYAGMHAALFQNPDLFITRVLIPLVHYYRDHPAIFAWELINEPEFAMKGTGSEYLEQQISIQEMQLFAIRCNEAIHQYSSKKVTMGSAHPHLLQYWTDDALRAAGATSDQGLLDFYQIHLYPWSPEGFSWDMPSKYNKPILIGEAPPNTIFSTTAEVMGLQANGFMGVLWWSFYNDGATNGNWTRIEKLIKNTKRLLPHSH